MPSKITCKLPGTIPTVSALGLFHLCLSFKWINGLCALLCFIPLRGNAQPLRQQVQTWASVNSTFRFSDTWGLMADAHVRRTDGIRYPSFYFARLGAVYWLQNGMQLAAGVGNLWLAPPPNTYNSWALEPRLYQQAQWSKTYARMGLLQRIRLEQRWRQQINTAADEPTNQFVFNHRFRYLLSCTFPVSFSKSSRWVVSDELLLLVPPTSYDRFRLYEQNRLFLGWIHTLSPQWSYDFGYMNVLQQAPNGQLTMNHTIRLFFYFRKQLHHSTTHHTDGNE